MADDTPLRTTLLLRDHPWPGFAGNTLPALDVTSAVEAAGALPPPLGEDEALAELRRVMTSILSSLDPDQALRQALERQRQRLEAATSEVGKSAEPR